MKRRIVALVAVLLSIGGCASNTQPAEATTTQAQYMLKIKTQDANTYDIDLKGANANICYATVFQMVNQPESYAGMTVRMEGLYTETQSDDGSKTYHFCVIPDAMACCKQGIEFISKNTDSYPALDASIEITGIYSSYEENGCTYYYVDTEGLTEL